MKTLCLVKPTNTYGKIILRPANPTAESVCKLMGLKSIPHWALGTLDHLGIIVECETQRIADLAAEDMRN